MAAARGPDMEDTKIEPETASRMEDNKIAADQDEDEGTKQGAGEQQVAKDDSTSEASPIQVFEEVPLSLVLDGGATAEAATASEGTDGEPFLGFVPLAVPTGKAAVSPTMDEMSCDTSRAQEPMDTAPVQTRKRKGDPVSPSSLSDGRKDGSYNTDPNHRSSRPQ